MIPRRADNARENTRLEIEGTQNMRIHNNLFAASAFCLLSVRIAPFPGIVDAELAGYPWIPGYCLRTRVSPPLCTPGAPCNDFRFNRIVTRVHPLKIFILARALSLSLSRDHRSNIRHASIHEFFSSRIHIYIYIYVCIIYRIDHLFRNRQYQQSKKFYSSVSLIEDRYTSILLFSRDRINRQLFELKN